jgi:beta-glucanase (GH16 family)
MRSVPSVWLAAAAAVITPVYAQTSSKCNPLNTQCPADPALGKSVTINFASGQSDQFTASGNPTYDGNGAHFSVAGQGDAPTITSNWYIMFGRVDVTMQAAPGTGIVSSLVLESDDLDEVDFEWLGGDDNQVQSNYFGKGQTGSYNRGAFHSSPGNHDGMHTYSVEWTADSISWIIDGSTVRTLTPDAAAGQYPQTPMQLKLGVWAGGDPSNAPGTIQWAGGLVNYGGGPYTMTVKSVSAKDYSTGSSYSYGDSSGSWQSIKSSGGQVNSAGSGAAPPPPAGGSGGSGESSGSSGSSSSKSAPNIWPWVASSSTLSSASTPAETLPGLPSGWTVTSSGKVVPPSSAPVSEPPLFAAVFAWALSTSLLV